MSESIDIDAVTRAIAAFDLPNVGDPGGIELAHLRDRPLNDGEWHQLLSSIKRSRLEGALAWSLAHGAWEVSPTRRAEAYEAHQRAMSLTLALERELVELVDTLRHRTIEVRVLKGSALARLDEPDPSLRAFGDVDLLVRGEHLETVDRVLTERGGRRRFAEPRAGFDRRFSKGMSYAFDRNCEIDVHRTLAAGPFGMTIDLDELFDNVEPLVIGDHHLWALDRPSRFIHACFHAVLGSARPRVSALRDIVRTVPDEAPELRATLQRAQRWHADTVVAAAVRTTKTAFDWTPPPELDAWTAHHHDSRRRQRWLAGYVGESRSYARQMIDGFQAVSGPADKVAYALAITMPSPSSGRSPTSERLRRGLRALRQARR